MIHYKLVTSRFTNLRPGERDGLVHEGWDTSVTSAYVEIVFDNHDDFLPVGGEELTLRCTIAMGMDKFNMK